MLEEGLKPPTLALIVTTTTVFPISRQRLAKVVQPWPDLSRQRLRTLEIHFCCFSLFVSLSPLGLEVLSFFNILTQLTQKKIHDITKENVAVSDAISYAYLTYEHVVRDPNGQEKNKSFKDRDCLFSKNTGTMAAFVPIEKGNVILIKL